jgi:hypothetical protein
MIAPLFWIILWTTVLFLISSIPLYLTVKLLGGKTTILYTATISLVAGIIIGTIKLALHTWGSLVAFIVLIWIYHEAFRLKWWKAFIAWFLQSIVLWLLILLAVTLGAAAIGLALIF